MVYALHNVSKNEIYGFYDISSERYIWVGSFKDVLKQLKYENDNGHLNDLRHLSFCGVGIWDNQNLTSKDTKLSSSYFSVDEHSIEYGYRNYCLVHHVGNVQRNVSITDIYTIYRKEIQGIENRKPEPYKRKPKQGRKHRKLFFYKSAKSAGRRLELARFKEDRQYIPNLSKKGLVYFDYYKDGRKSNSWKDNKIRHQWQKHVA